jgi:hypothetical protein
LSVIRDLAIGAIPLLLSEITWQHAHNPWNGAREGEWGWGTSEPEFLNILKCNSTESASTGFPFNFIIFFMIKLTVIMGFQQLFRSVEIAIKFIYASFNKK